MDKINKRNAVIGAVSGGIAGAAGAWLMSDYDISLLSVVLIGVVIGICVGLVSKFMKKKN